MNDIRILIIDNASSDDSIEVARALAAEDGRIELVMHPANRGPHASFNEGIDAARAEYLTILCADDFLTAGALARACDALDHCPEAAFAIGTKLTLIESQPYAEPAQSAEWRLVDGDQFIEACCRSLGFTLALGAVVVRTAVQKAAGHYRAYLPYTDDLEMALRLARRGAVVEFEAALGVRREHTTQMSESVFGSERKRLEEREAAFGSFFSAEGRDMAQAGRLLRTARRGLAEIACRSAVKHLLAGNAAAAADLVKYVFNWRGVVRSEAKQISTGSVIKVRAGRREGGRNPDR